MSNTCNPAATPYQESPEVRTTGDPRNVLLSAISTANLSSDEINTVTSHQYIPHNSELRIFTDTPDTLAVTSRCAGRIIELHLSLLGKSIGPTGQFEPPTGKIGDTGPTGCSSNVTGPTGASSIITGPTGCSSNVTGPTGPASTVTGPTGPASTITGPTGSSSTITGATGPTGEQGFGNTGPTGDPGMSVTGPTGESIIGPTGEPGLSITGPTGASSTITGPTGATGPVSTITGPTGHTGPTGAASTITGPTGATGPSSTITGPTGAASTITGPTGAASTVTGPTGAASTVTGPTGEPGLSITGSTGPQGPPGLAGGDTGNISTFPLSLVNTTIVSDQTNNSVHFAVIYSPDAPVTVNKISCYVYQTGGAGSGPLQMGIASLSSPNTITLLAVTNPVLTLTGGIFTLNLLNPIVLTANTVYFVVVKNQVNGSLLGAFKKCTNLTQANGFILTNTALNVHTFAPGTVISNSGGTNYTSDVWLALR